MKHILSPLGQHRIDASRQLASDCHDGDACPPILWMTRLDTRKEGRQLHIFANGAPRPFDEHRAKRLIPTPADGTSLHALPRGVLRRDQTTEGRQLVHVPKSSPVS